MTDSRAPRVEHDTDPGAGTEADEPMLTTGEAAKVIGFRTTRKQVIALIADDLIAHVRPKPGAWARIPMSAAVAYRQQLERKLAESESRRRAQERLAQDEDD
jgi:hypothetical protein